MKAFTILGDIAQFINLSNFNSFEIFSDCTRTKTIRMTKHFLRFFLFAPGPDARAWRSNFHMNSAEQAFVSWDGVLDT
jgi:hypothetical protein